MYDVSPLPFVPLGQDQGDKEPYKFKETLVSLIPIAVGTKPNHTFEYTMKKLKPVIS
jgi:hypothetical protein